MYNDILSVGPFTIHGYGLMIGIGIACALLIGDYRAKKNGLDGDLVYGMILTTVLFGFLGAKILFCLIEWKAFLADPIGFFSGNGFVVYGGIIAGILTMYLYCKIKKVSFLSYFDILVVSTAVAQGFGRIGCFLAGCCYGKETTCALGITFHNSDFAPNGIKLMPTQLMSAAGDFFIAFLLFMYARKSKISGKVGSLYLILYGIGRFIIEFFRNDYRGSVGIFSTSQFISLFIVVIGIILFFIVMPQIEKRKSLVTEKENTTVVETEDTTVIEKEDTTVIEKESESKI